MTSWAETRRLPVALRDAKKNGRVGKLFSVLRDGEPRTRREIFERVGFMLTNNAASELRRELEPQGYGVAQWSVVENGEQVYVYQLVALPERAGDTGVSAEEVPHDGRASAEARTLPRSGNASLDEPLTSAGFGEPKHAWDNGGAGRGSSSDVAPHRSGAAAPLSPLDAAPESQLALVPNRPDWA